MIVPRSRPMQNRGQSEAILLAHGVNCSRPALLGVRGYYLDTMGAPGRNDRGLYDDAIFLVTPEKYISYNANCDPAAARRGIANLCPGVWQYRVGIHGLSKPKERQYTALVQAAEVTVQRDGVGRDTGWFGINIHRGSYNSTSSEGCQTIHPDQWPQFIAEVQLALQKHGQKVIPYCLIEIQS